MKGIIRDKKHLEFIRKLPCVRCGGNAIAAHIRKGTNGGTGIKPGDDWTLPLCHTCHSEQHQIGEVAFYKDLEKARQLARDLYLLSGDIYTAVNLARRAKCILF